MNNTKDAITLAPRWPEGNRPLQRIRLLTTAQVPVLFASSTVAEAPRHTTSILSAPVTGGGALEQRLQIHQLLPGFPMWDVADELVVLTKFGGALHWLELYRISGEVSRLTDPESMRDFIEPRFIRGGQGVTARVDKSKLVLFDTAAANNAAEPRDIGETGDIPLIVRTGGGSVLLYKQRQWGPVRGVVTAPGSLVCRRVNEDYSTAGPSEKPLGDDVIYEFDAVPAGENVIVCATTKDGFALAEISSAGPIRVLSRIGQGHAKELHQAAIAVEDSRIYLAFLQAPAKSEADVLAGSVTLERLRATE